jgi:hypothetical protein
MKRFLFSSVVLAMALMPGTGPVVGHGAGTCVYPPNEHVLRIYGQDDLSALLDVKCVNRDASIKLYDFDIDDEFKADSYTLTGITGHGQGDGIRMRFWSNNLLLDITPCVQGNDDYHKDLAAEDDNLNTQVTWEQCSF